MDVITKREPEALSSSGWTWTELLSSPTTALGAASPEPAFPSFSFNSMETHRNLLSIHFLLKSECVSVGGNARILAKKCPTCMYRFCREKTGSGLEVPRGGACSLPAPTGEKGIEMYIFHVWKTSLLHSNNALQLLSDFYILIIINQKLVVLYFIWDLGVLQIYIVLFLWSLCDFMLWVQFLVLEKWEWCLSPRKDQAEWFPRGKHAWKRDIFFVVVIWMDHEVL